MKLTCLLIAHKLPGPVNTPDGEEVRKFDETIDRDILDRVEKELMQ